MFSEPIFLFFFSDSPPPFSICFYFSPFFPSSPLPSFPSLLLFFVPVTPLPPTFLRQTTTEFMLPEHAEIRHRDFEMRMHREHSDYNLLGAHDFAWPEHGFGLVSRYYPEAAAPLDHLFRHTYAMTDGTFSTGNPLGRRRRRRLLLLCGVGTVRDVCIVAF